MPGTRVRPSAGPSTSLVPGIHDLLTSPYKRKTWMAGTSPAMTSATQINAKFKALDAGKVKANNKAF